MKYRYLSRNEHWIKLVNLIVKILSATCHFISLPGEISVYFFSYS